MRGDICRINNCTKRVTARKGMVCGMHMSRFFRHRNYDFLTERARNYGRPNLTKCGYMRICVNGKRVLEHRHIMETHLGRKLTNRERIHHINHNKTDNRIENLELMSSQSEHLKHHRFELLRNRKTNPVLPPRMRKEIIKTGNSHRRNYKIRKCGVSVCNQMGRTRGLCGKHYQWWWKHH